MTRALVVVFVARSLVDCSARTADTMPMPGQCSATFSCGGGLVCTRDGMCLPPDQVRSVHVTWTVSGAAASPTSCAVAPDLLLDLTGPNGLRLGFEPVPCAEGKFSVDRLPIEYDEVSLGRASSRAQLEHASIDAAGNATVNLPY